MLLVHKPLSICKKESEKVGETAKLVNHLPQKYEELSSVLSTSVKTYKALGIFW